MFFIMIVVVIFENNKNQRLITIFVTFTVGCETNLTQILVPSKKKIYCYEIRRLICKCVCLLFQMILSQHFISNHIKQWINAWNSKDIELILSLYSDNIEFSSPKIKKLFSDYDTNIIKDKDSLKKYFSIGLQKFPNLIFEPIDFVTKDNIIILEYIAYTNDQVNWNVLEKFKFDENGKVIKSSVYYGIEEENTH